MSATYERAQSTTRDVVATVGMGQRVRRRRGAMTAALLAAAVTGSLLTGCTVGGDPRDDGRGAHPEQRPERTASPRRTALPGPGAGPERTPAPERAAGPVLAVKIDNVRPARPQSGLDTADVVYAEQVEGGLSRLMAVYATKLPKSVGPVRSARESDLDLLGQFDEPTLAYSGAQRRLLPLIDRAALRGVRPEDDAAAYYRAPGRAAPHDLYVRPRRLMDSVPGAAALTTGFRYGPAPSGGTPERTRTVRYPSARFTFTWSAGRGRWLVSMGDTRAVTPEGRAVAPATVVVQHVKVVTSRFHDVLGSNTPFTQTVGSGKAEVLRDGRSYRAAWQRPSASSGTDFTAPDGSPLNFAKGQVWVVFTQD
ncbi:DUF3048 domain-containing protein [Streptomyces sp. NPDC059786]|uniref:DUF3048 domain-containing protein n=1 Tax=Streptomyces sp. NPDC059786 TaxID=3346946 RepID=UPI00364E6321